MALQRTFDNVIIQGGTYSANSELELVSVSISDTNIQKIVNNLHLSNYSSNNTTITIKMDNNILITYSLAAGEYMRYEGPILVKPDQALKIISTDANIDITIPMFEILTYDMA